jgi:hypothetical protein
MEPESGPSQTGPNLHVTTCRRCRWTSVSRRRRLHSPVSSAAGRKKMAIGATCISYEREHARSAPRRNGRRLRRPRRVLACHISACSADCSSDVDVRWVRVTVPPAPGMEAVIAGRPHYRRRHGGRSRTCPRVESWSNWHDLRRLPPALRLEHTMFCSVCRGSPSSSVRRRTPAGRPRNRIHEDDPSP